MIKLVAPFSASGGSVVSVNGKMGVVVLTPEDIGALPEGALEGYATEQYVNEQIENIDIPETDLTGYATESYVKEEIAKAQLEGEEVDLSAYATKQYVSEQVNAIELMPGPAGPQGPKGQDGYTPVKGVDYFDGAPGQPGKDGTDGKDGQDGAPGKDGVDGKDYVLTDADKQEIAGMVEVTGGESADLSDYYTRSEVDELIANAPGTGGSVNIDNKTIIEEDGVIKTAAGGYMAVIPENAYYSFYDEYGHSASSGKIRFDDPIPAETIADMYDRYNNKGEQILYRITYSSGTTENQMYEGVVSDFNRSNDELYVIALGGWFGGGYFMFCRAEDDYIPYIQGYNGKVFSFEFYTPAFEEKQFINNELIDTDYIATKAYVEELIGGIENGSY